MNNVFKRLNKPRITKFASSLVGHSLPARTKANSSIVGVYVDKLVRIWAGASTGVTTGVDLKIFGIEVKTQDIHTGSNWTIGTMTFADLVKTPYEESSLYEKLQALFLVRYDNELQIITDSNLHYMDNDEVQGIFKEAYETARREAIAYLLNFKESLAQRMVVFGDEKITFAGSLQFKGTPGYCFEFTNSGTSFKFRVSNKAMKRATKLATANNTGLFEFV